MCCEQGLGGDGAVRGVAVAIAPATTVVVNCNEWCVLVERNSSFFLDRTLLRKIEQVV